MDNLRIDYLRLLDSYYHQWGADYAESPVLTVNSHRFDFVNTPGLDVYAMTIPDRDRNASVR